MHGPRLEEETRWQQSTPEPHDRADQKHQVVADQEWQTLQVEDKQNQELLGLSHQILELTKQVHTYATARSDGTPTRDA